MSSRGKGARSADRLVGIKAIQRFLHAEGIHATRNTLNRWRRQNPPSLKPPIAIEILDMRPCLTASKASLHEWIAKGHRRHLFQRSQRNHETRERRANLVRKVEQVNGLK